MAHTDATKPANRDYCFRHRTYYEGWECPRCLDDEYERNTGHRRAQTGTGIETDEVEVTDEGDGNDMAAAPPVPSEVASEAKTAEAERMLAAREGVEAGRLCTEAIALDPENLQAHLLGIRAARLTRDMVRELTLIEAAVALLPRSRYRANAAWYHAALKCARNAANVHDIVRHFLDARPWPTEEIAQMMALLVARELNEEVLRLFLSLQPAQRSLLVCAYALHVAGRSVAVSADEVKAYLATVPFDRRDEALMEFTRLVGDRIFSPAILSVIKNALKARYEKWLPEIEQAVEAEARARAARQVGDACNSPALVTATLALAGLVFADAVVALVIARSTGLFLFGTVPCVGGAAGAFWLGRGGEIRRREGALVPGLIDEMSTEELERWRPVFEDAPAETPPPAADTPAPETAASSPSPPTADFPTPESRLPNPDS